MPSKMAADRGRGCVAVGLIRTGQNQIARTIAEWWNGRAWRPLRLPA